jgi:hypothetical protein
LASCGNTSPTQSAARTTSRTSSSSLTRLTRSRRLPTCTRGSASRPSRWQRTVIATVGTRSAYADEGWLEDFPPESSLGRRIRRFTHRGTTGPPVAASLRLIPHTAGQTCRIR